MPSKKALTKPEKSAATRQAIIDVAAGLFARDGYSDTALGEIVKAADITTGAVYHHFGDKKGLFQAVAESLEQEILDEVSALIADVETPWQAFETGILKTLEICARPDIQRIVFREAPAVIGLREWRDIEVNYAFGLMRATITQLAEANIIRTDSPDMTAQILLGALMEAAHSVAEAKVKSKALKAAKETLSRMIAALKQDR